MKVNRLDELEKEQSKASQVVMGEETIPKKKKKKDKCRLSGSHDAEKLSQMQIDNIDIQENIDNVNHDANGNSEAYNTSVTEETTSVMSLKKKKKKKKTIDGNIDADVIMSSEKCVDSGIEDECITPASKKRKKKHSKDINQNGTEIKKKDKIPDNETGLEGLDDEGNKEENDSEEDDVKEKEKADEDSEIEDPQEDLGFTMIDAVKQMKKPKVERVLPEWLSNPTAVSMNLLDGVPVSDMQGLKPFLKKLVRSKNISRFFPVQAAVIPELLANANSLSMRYRPRDICVSAPTGSGKTLAYVLPIIQALSNRVVPQIRALILLPTQELARQVHDVIASYTRFTKLIVSLAVGGRSLQKDRATLLFRDTQGDYAADILVATPGKLNSHLGDTNRLSFQHLRFLVMDEADLFSSSSGGSFMLQLEKLLKKIVKPTPDNSVISGGFQPSGCVKLPEHYLQKVLISATLMHDPEQLKLFNLHQPKLFTASDKVGASDTLKSVGAYMRPQELIEEYVFLNSTQKPLVLHHLISTSNLDRVLVFTKSIESTHNLAIVLSALSSDLKVAEFSSSAANRRKIIEDFHSRKINVLVSSDAMARGIDIRGIQQVVSYDVPSVQTYVHRCGRTGRAGKLGYSLCLVEDTVEAKRDFKPILTSCKDRFKKIYVSERDLVKYEEQYKAALGTLKSTLHAEKMEKKKKSAKGNKLRTRKNQDHN